MYFFEEDINKKNQTFIISDCEGNVTYEQLDSFCETFQQYVKPRKLLFLMCANEIGAIFGYLACLRNKVVPVLLDQNMDCELFENLKEIYDPDYIFGPSCQEGEDVFAAFGYHLVHRQTKKQTKLYDELAVLLTTSGSTGSPKLVRQSYENIQSNAASIAQYLELNQKERPITTLPMNYTYGLSIINSHVLCGATILLTKKTLLQQEFWEFFQMGKATSFGGVPFTYEMLHKINFVNMELPSLKTMTQAGGKLPVHLHKIFATYAKENGKKFIVMYGQTEATARMSYLPAKDALRKVGSMGIAIPGGAFSIEDGELVYRGKNVTLGYAERKEDLAKEDERNGILYTGDMAKVDEEGYYYIVGRKKRFLKILGSRINLDEVEQLLKGQYEGIMLACTGKDDCLEVYMEENQESEEEIRTFLSQKTGLNEGLFHIIQVEKIPVNASGKTLYEALRR